MQSSLQACDRPPGFSELAFDAATHPTHIGCFIDEFEGTPLTKRMTSCQRLPKVFRSGHRSQPDLFQKKKKKDNFVKALRFSPCGSLLACSSDDNYLRLFEVPPEAVAQGKEAPWPPKRRRRRRRRRRNEDDESESGGGSGSESSSDDDDDDGDAAAAGAAAEAAPPIISLSRSWHAGDIVHDLCFHPLGGADDPDRGGRGRGGGCLGFGPPLLAVAARDHPVHLLGPLLPPSSRARDEPPPSQPPVVASFVPLDRAVEPATTTALCFTPDGATLALGGRSGSVALFDVSRPGRAPRAVVPAPAPPRHSKRREPPRGRSALSFGSGGFGSSSSNGGGAGAGAGAGVPLQFGKRRHPGRSYDAVSAPLPSSPAAAAAAAGSPLTHCPLRGGSSMVSALACSSSAAAHLPPLLAVGFVSGLVSVADPRTGEVLLSLEGGHTDAATTLTWSPCGWYLYSAARRDGAVRCWDVRGAASVLPAAAAGGGGGGGTLGGGCALSLSRASRWTQQRIALAVEPVSGRHLLSGGEDGWVRAFDLRAAAAERADSAAAASPAAPAPPPPRPPPPSYSSSSSSASSVDVSCVHLHRLARVEGVSGRCGDPPVAAAGRGGVRVPPEPRGRPEEERQGRTRRERTPERKRERRRRQRRRRRRNRAPSRRALVLEAQLHLARK